MKKILLFFALLLVTTAMAQNQFKISANGNVGIGDIPHST